MFRFFVAEPAPPAEAGTEPRPPRASFPLFWLLVPQILAYAFCANAEWAAAISPGRWLVAGTFLLAAAGAAVIAENASCVCARFPNFRARDIWRAVFPIAAFFVFCAWWSVRVPAFVDWSQKSSREAEVELRVVRAYASAGKKFNGIGVVEQISGEALGALAGTRVWFTIPKNMLPIFVPESVSAAAADSDEAQNPSRRTRTEDALTEGARLRVAGVVRGISEDYFSQESFRKFLRRERVSAAVSANDRAEFVPDDFGAFMQLFGKAKSVLRAKLTAISGAEQGGSAGTIGFCARAGKILGAMLLGDRSLLLPEQKENFSLTGTIHVFAVSGLHVGVLAAGVFCLFRLIFRGRGNAAVASAASLAILLFYVFTVGAPPSAVRAWLMLFFVFAGTLFGRGRGAFHGLIFSAFVALLFNPMLLGNTGFRLSHLVVAAILLYGLPAAQALKSFVAFGRAELLPESKFLTWRGNVAVKLRLHSRELAQSATRGAIDGACISLAAFLAGAPIVVAMFGYCPFLSLPANILLIPLAVLAVWIGAAALCISFVPLVGELLGSAVFALAALPISAVDFGTARMAELPGTVPLSFPRDEFGAIGSVLVFAAFFVGEMLPALRERPLLRFALPPLVLAVFLLVSSF